MTKKRTHIELFAGCGGMALGMEAANFELLFANELSPMAGETFAYNILNENLLELSQKGKCSQKVSWISSKYPNNNLSDRLRENPLDSENKTYSDLPKNIDSLKDKLLIGDINELLNFFKENEELVNQIQNLNVDLLSGGPPCQGFSLAGLRVKDDHKNQLPMSFAEMASLIKPKVVLLENVKGITSPFTVEGKKHHAWLEVSKAFALKGFVPVCMMLNSKYYKVPQNRPRFILFAFRKDIFKLLIKSDPLNEILQTSDTFFKKVNNKNIDIDNITAKNFTYYDIENKADYFNGNLLPKITSTKEEFITANDAIGDILNPNKKIKISSLTSEYTNSLLDTFSNESLDKNNLLTNHEERNHSKLVKERFKLYQVISQFTNGLQTNAYRLISNRMVEPNEEFIVLNEIKKHNLGVDKTLTFKENSLLKKYIQERATRKHSQRALQADSTAPAQLTIPDDVCHYKETRTLTVREMARFQSFPDWFVFRSKVTTGGNQRKFEVPQYTQVGNAVPPLLAKVLGKTISNLLDIIDK